MNKIITLLCSLYILSVVFAPPLYISDLGIRYDDFILIPGLLIAVFQKPDKSLLPRPIVRLAFVIYAMITIVFLSSLFNSLWGAYEFAELFKEAIRYFKYLLVAALFLQIKDANSQAIIRGTLVTAAVFLVGLQLAQLFGSLAFNQALTEFYGGGIHFTAAASAALGYRQHFYAGGSFGNPNVAGAFFAIPISIIIWSVNNARSVRERVLWIILAIIIFTGIMLTRSRASTLAVLFVIMVSYFLYFRDRQQKVSAPIIIFLVSMGIVFWGWVWFSQNSFLYEFGEGLRHEGSFGVKIQNFLIGSELMLEQRAAFGLGPGNGPQVDFEYGYFWTWYGPLGLFTYLLFWGVILHSLTVDKSGYHNWKLLVAASFGFLVMNFSQTSFLTIRVFPLFIALFASQVNWVYWKEYKRISLQQATHVSRRLQKT